jgi:signal transduction histidine kinase
LVRQLVNPDEFLYAVAQMVGEYLLTQRSFFVELDVEHDRGFVWRDYCRGVPSVAGEYRLSQYSTEAGQEMDQGRTIVNHDSQVDPRTAPYYEKTYAPNGERAYVAVPLMREGHRVAALWVSTDTPRDWRSDDVTLLEAVAERAWLAVEKMRLDLEQIRLYEVEQRTRVELELRVHERTAELEQSSAQLSNLSARLQAMREEERQRLSLELHDQLGGALTGLKIDISQIHRRTTDSELHAQLKNLLTTIDGIIQIVRQLAMELRPAILDDFGLSAAIEWQLQEFEKRSGIRSRYTPEEIQVELDKEAATAVFRILQEALTNVVRHAQASEVNVQLQHQINYLVLQVHDNGRGISPSDLANLKSLGLVGMRERVRLFSGELDIQGTPGEGTTVLVRIPLKS